MAIRVTPARGMNGLSQKNFETATRYEVKETKFGLMLNIYEGTKKVSTYGPGAWESVDLYTPLDVGVKAKKATKTTGSRKKATKKTKPPAAPAAPRTRTLIGASIRTSPMNAGHNY